MTDSGETRPFRAALAPLLPLYGLDVLTAFTVGMLPPLLPLIAAEWALSTVEAALVNTVYAVGRLLGSYPTSWLRARQGTRTAVFVGIAGLVAGSLVCGLAPAFPALLAGRLLMGLGGSAAFLALFAELLESAAPAWRGRLTNLFEGLAILSLAVGGVLAAALARAAGWRAVFVALGPVLLVGLFAWPRIGPLAGRRPPAAAGGVGAFRRDDVHALGPIYAAGFAMALTWAGLFTTLVPLLGHGRYGLGAPAIGLALGAGYLAELVGLFALALVIDRVRREPFFLGGALSVTLGALVLAAGARPALFVLGLVFIGGGFAVWMIPATVLADRAGIPIAPAHLAGFRVALDTGMIVGPLLLGGAAELLGERLAVGGAGFVLVAGALVLRRRPKGSGGIIAAR